jgi:chaperone BCS1
MTCRDADALAPALVRPGRIDRRLAFEPPDFSQAARLFLRFYAGHLDRAPSSAEEERAEEERAEEGAGETNEGGENVTGRGRKTRTVVSALGGAPSRLERSAAEALSARFARHATGPGSDPRVSMAALQGHLMMHREDPEGAVEAAASAFRARKANGER